MYDAGKVIPGLVVFLGLVTLPVWYNAGTGKTGHVPELAKAQGKECVAPVETMRAQHMDLLNEWRDRVAREGERYITDAHGHPVLIGGRKWEMSLTNACMECHNNKAEFCDQCHNYLAVDPYCWDCHLTPEDIETWQSIEEDS